MNGRLAIITTGLPARAGGLTAMPRLQAPAAGQTRPCGSVNVAAESGWLINASISRCAMTSEVESRRFAPFSPMAKGTSLATPTMPITSTRVATITSMIVKPLCRLPCLVIFCGMFCGMAKFSILRLTDLMPVSRCIGGPHLNGTRRHQNHGSVTRGRNGGIPDIQHILAGSGGIRSPTIVERVHTIYRGSSRKSRNSDCCSQPSGIGNVRSLHQRDASAQESLRVRSLLDSVSIWVCPDMCLCRSALHLNQAIDLRVQPYRLGPCRFQNSGHLRGRIVQLVRSIGLQERRHCNRKHDEQYGQDSHKLDQREAAH